MKTSLVPAAIMIGIFAAMPCLAERLPYLRADESPFKLDYEAEDEYDEYYLLNSAREAEAMRDWPRALFLYGELHRMDDLNPEYLFAMARMCFMQYKCDEALAYIDKLPDTYAPRDLSMVKAGSLLYVGRFKEAADLFARMLEEDPKLTLAMRGMAEAMLADNRFEEAADVFKRMLELDPGLIDDIPDLKKSLLSAGEDGPERWSYILKVYARSRTLGTLFSPIDAATMTFTQVDREKGLELLVDAVEKNPDSAALHSQLGLLYNAMGNKQQAKQQMDKAVELAPDDAYVINNRGVLAMQLGDDAQAIESFSRAIELKPDYSQALRNLARLHYSRKEWKESAYIANQSIIIDQNSFDARMLAGFSSYKLGYFEDAMQYIGPLLTEDMDRPSVWFLAGISAHRLGRWSEAERYYRKGLTLKEDYVLGLNNLADLLVSNPKADADDVREAMDLAKKASALTLHNSPVVEKTLQEVREKYTAMGLVE